MQFIGLGRLLNVTKAHAVKKTQEIKGCYENEQKDDISFCRNAVF